MTTLLADGSPQLTLGDNAVELAIAPRLDRVLLYVVA